MNPAYWIAFGPHGPRALPPPGQNWFIFWSVMGITGVCCVVFFIIRLFARGPPSTMTREWQEATNEYLRVRSHPRLRLPPLQNIVFLFLFYKSQNRFWVPKSHIFNLNLFFSSFHSYLTSMCHCMVMPDFPPVSFPSLVTPSPTDQPVHVEIGPKSRAHHRPFL